MNYMEDLFVDPNKLILVPKEVNVLNYYIVIFWNKKVNALYVILLGTVKVYDNTPESLNLLKKTLILNEKKLSQSRISLSNSRVEYQPDDNNRDLQCIDDLILNEFKSDLLNEKDKNSLFKSVKDLEYGEYFGCK